MSGDPFHSSRHPSWPRRGSALAAASLLAFGVGTAAAGSFPQQKNGAANYQAGQSISYAFGSKQMSGYFIRENSRCSATLMLIERFDAESGQDVSSVSATRVRLILWPGQVAGLDSEEKRSLNISCGEDAAFMTVETGPRDALVARQREGLVSAAAFSR